MSSREVVLERVRKALGDKKTRPMPPTPAARPSTPARGSEELVPLFVDRVVDYRATVIECTEDELERTVLQVVGGTAVVVPPGLSVHVEGAVVDDAVDVGRLDGDVAVVTACRVAIAETGTIVLDHAADQGRRAITLVPDHHVCIVRAEQVVADVPDAVPLLDPRTPQTWISGPSATSDIELDRVEGVHGPRRLTVLVVSPPPQTA